MKTNGTRPPALQRQPAAAAAGHRGVPWRAASQGDAVGQRLSRPTQFHQSPRMVSQRRAIDATFGQAVQPRTADVPRATMGARDAVLQGMFDLTAVPRQSKNRGGVTAGYTAAPNIADLHIAAGANLAGELMQNFLMTLWEVRDTLQARQAAGGPAGTVEMHPGGSQVLKMTMEMLGEAVGQNPARQQARAAKHLRQVNNLPLTTGNNVLDGTVVPEHVRYRDSLIGVGGVTMNPVGGGTTGGTVDMLQNNAAGAAERALYDTALATLQPFMSINVTITLPVLLGIIGMLEGRMSNFQRWALQAKYALLG